MIPSGNVTFLFTDIEGSTKLSQEFPETLQTSLEKHFTIMQDAIESNSGFVFELVGDAFCCAFKNVSDAIKAAVDAQINLANEKWDDAVIKVRMGIHSGNAEWTETGQRYMGYITLARAARVMSAAYGQQIIILIQPIKLYQIVSSELKSDFPPLKTLDAGPNNLPVQLTNFIGREKEMEKVKKLLSSIRLLTLLGPGETGKTRLSLQVGADLIDDFANEYGLWNLH